MCIIGHIDTSEENLRKLVQVLLLKDTIQGCQLLQADFGIFMLHEIMLRKILRLEKETLYD